MTETYTADQAISALCIFEWLIAKHEQKDELIHRLFSNYGWGGMRSVVLDAAVIAERTWQHACGADDEPEHFETYDWEFIPAFCLVLDWDRMTYTNQYHPLTPYEPNVEELWATMVAKRAMKVA